VIFDGVHKGHRALHDYLSDAPKKETANQYFDFQYKPTIILAEK
jgi:FAD synthase